LFDVRGGNGDVVRVLLDGGADPDAQNNHGISPLSIAEAVVNYDLMRIFR
jgi:ankyrin repeat protein